MASTDAGRSVLVGMVVTPDGWPVPHAMVTVVDETGRQSGRGAADHDGRFTVVGLPPGTHTVITAAAGHAPQARTRLVNGAGPVDLGRLVLSRVSGTVLPIPGTWNIDPIDSTVSATAVHLGFAKIHGRFRDFTGTVTLADPLEDSSVEVVIEAASIDTDNADATPTCDRRTSWTWPPSRRSAIPAAARPCYVRIPGSSMANSP